MQQQKFTLVLFIIISLLFNSCSVTRKNKSASSLKSIYKNDFYIGAAVNALQIEEKDIAAAALIPQQFSALTPENIMKSEVIHPAWNTYNFELADKLIAYGKKHNIKINGHTLIWHSQLPAYVKNIQSADSIKLFFENHITTLASRYDNKIYSWDVVNEALNEDGTMRNSIFLQKLGADYVTAAFKLAQQVAPHTQLYYNDYNIEQPKKRNGAIELIKKIKAAGVRIDGVGIQGHWHLGTVPYQDIEESIQEFSKLGIKVMFTELDISVLPNPKNHNTADVNATAEATANANPYTTGLPDSIQHQLADNYFRLFKLFMKYKNEISRVTFWGINDEQSWLNNFPVKGRTNHPLLFDRNYQPKEAYYKLLELPQKQ